MTYDLILAVLQRPKMYTLSGDFSSVVAFLEGYYSGLAKSSKGLPYAEHWSLFRQWLATQIESSDQSEPLKVLMETHQDRALDILGQYYNEFNSNNTNKA